MVSVQCVTENMANCYHVHIFWRYCYTVTHYTSSQEVYVHPGRIRPPKQYSSSQVYLNPETAKSLISLKIAWFCNLYADFHISLLFSEYTFTYTWIRWEIVKRSVSGRTYSGYWVWVSHHIAQGDEEFFSQPFENDIWRVERVHRFPKT